MVTHETIKEHLKMKRSTLTMNAWARANAPAAPKRFHFWYLGVLRLCVGIAQIIAVGWCFILLVQRGIDARTMHVAFVGVGITTASLLLFKVLGVGHQKNK